MLIVRHGNGDLSPGVIDSCKVVNTALISPRNVVCNCTCIYVQWGLDVQQVYTFHCVHVGEV